MKKQLFKRISACVATVTVAASMLLPLPAGATDTTQTTHMGHVGVSYMGTGEWPDFAGTSSTLDTSSWTAKDGGTDGTKFWVGYYLSDLATLDYDGTHIFDSITGSDDNGGLFRIATGINYPSEFVTPLNLTTEGAKQFVDTFYEDPDWAEKATGGRRNSDLYDAYSCDSAEIQSVPNRLTESTNIPEKYNPQVAYASMSTTNWANTGRWFGAGVDNDKHYFSYVQFELIKKPSDSDSLTISVARNTQQMCFEFGNNGLKWSGTWNPTTETTSPVDEVNRTLKYHFIYDGDLKIYDAGAENLESITVSGSPNMTYVEGSKFDPTNLEVTPTTNVEAKSKIEPTVDDYKNLKFYWADTNDKTDETLTKDADHEITKDTALSVSTHNGKYVYVVYTPVSPIGGTAKSKIVSSSPLTVSARQLTAITLDTETVIDDDETTFGKSDTTYYAGKEVINLLADSAGQDIVVDLEYNNGDKVDNVHYDDFTTNDLALYYVDDDGKLQVVDANLSLKEGTNTFYVAATGNADKEPTAVTVNATLTVTGTKDKTNITSVTDSTPTSLSYKSTETEEEQPTLDFDDIEIATATDSGTTQSKKVSEHPDDFIFFYVDDNTTPPSEYDDGDGNQHKVGADTKYTPQMNGKTLYVVPADNPTATPTEVGELADRKLVAASSPEGTFTPDGTVYGDTLAGKAQSPKFKAVYDNGEEETYEGFNQFPDEVKMRVVDPANDHEPLPGYGDIDENTTVLTPDMDGKHLEFYMSDGSGEVVFNGTGATEQHIPLHVGKKPVHVTLTATTPTSPTKTYDRTTKLVDAADIQGVPTIGITTTDLIAADQTTVASGATVTGVTLEYSDKNAGENKNIVITIANNAAVTEITDFIDNYTLVPDDGSMTTTGSTTVHKTIKGTISPKAITDDPAVKAPAAILGDDTSFTGSGRYSMTASDGIVTGDEVWFEYEYAYNGDDVTEAHIGNNTVDVDITPASPALTGQDAANYTYSNTTKFTSDHGGSVTNKTLDSISVTPTTQTYTYPALTLDATTVSVSYNYDNGTPDVKTMAEFLADNGAISVTAPAGSSAGNAITAANVSTFKFDAYGEWKLTFSKDGKTAELTITVKKKPIKLSDFTLTAEQKYNDASSQTTDSAFAGTGTSPIIDSDGDGTPDDVQITFDAEFTDPNAGENKDFTAKNLELTGDDADNYEIVDDSGAPIPSSTTATGKGTITQGTQTAPGAVTLTKDNTDNSVDITGPVTEDGTIEYRYSTDGGSTWSDWSTDTTIENLPTNKNVTVQARVKETDDGNYAPSEAVEGTITTFKNHVTVYKVNSTTVLAEAYTDETTVTSDSGFNSSDGILGSKPSRFKAYYTDKEGKTKIEYPFTLKAETTLYMTQTSGGGGGGGGGGGSSVTVTFPESKLEGYVNDTLTLTPTITGTTNKPTWTSHNEDVATVDENGNVKLLKEGEVRITASVGGVQKSVTITVKPEKQGDVVTPTPTPKPDAPLINTEYTKPYASGYDDGTFLPDNNITRAELASMIARLINGDDIPDGAYDSSFPDVPDNAWYNKYVGYLEAYDVISGYEDNTYRPENQVTRGELAAVITRAQKYDIISADGMFTDVTDADWAKDYITTLATLGIVSGYTNGTFAPYSPLTRAEAVTMINNVLAPSTAIMTFMPSDISGHWAEGNIILAVNEREVNGALETLVPEVDEAVPEETPAPEVDETATEAEETAPEDSETANETDEPAPEDGTTADPGSVTDPTE